MNKLDQDIFRYIREQSLLATGDRVLIACSGGVDSVALLHFFSVNRKRLGVEVAAVHVDHMLRGAESAADGTFVEELCETVGIPFFSGQVPVPDILKKEGGNVQAICREERYVFFSEVMREHRYNILVTAHHAEDQLETVLMQVTKGATPTGIPIKREINGGVLIRPFLPAVKKTLYAYAVFNQLQFREDPSNNTDDYMRNRFRRHISPHILHENPVAAEKVVQMAGDLQEDGRLLEALAKEQLDKIVEFTDEGLPLVNRRTFSNVPTSLQRRMIPLLLGYLYNKESVPVNYKSTLIGQILHHLRSRDGNVSIDLPLGYRLLREYDKLMFVRGQAIISPNIQKVLPKGRRTSWIDNLWLYWIEADRMEADLLTNVEEMMYFDLPNELLPLYVRRRQGGDRIKLPGMSRTKRLSRLFIDEKVSETERSRLPVIVTATGEVCAVPGLRYGEAFKRHETLIGKYIFILGKY